VGEGAGDAGEATRLDEIEAKLLFEEIDPACGWLTCVSGPRQGQSYVIRGGKNFIGRADDMDIRLLGDDSVARRNHAIVAYDAMNRQFMLLPGESNELVYLDGKAVFLPTPIEDMSVIQLGRVRLLFKPLCGEDFDWSGDVGDFQRGRGGAWARGGDSLGERGGEPVTGT
jgi:hypothetical protein